MEDKVIVPASIVPKATVDTTGFKLMLASWLAAVIITVLGKYKIYLPETLQGQLSDLIVAGIDALAYTIAGFITHKIASASMDKNAGKQLAVNDIVQAQVAPTQSTNIGSVEVSK